MTECSVSDEVKWAADVMQAASVTLTLFLIAGAATFYYFRPKGVEIPRYGLTRIAYIGAIIGEAIAIGFGIAYVIHLVPCFWSRCHSQSGNGLLAPAYMLAIAWPILTFGILGTRYMGWETVSIFHLVPSKPAPLAFQATQVASAEGSAERLFATPTFGIMRA